MPIPHTRERVKYRNPSSAVFGRGQISPALLVAYPLYEK
jgi:hypothetical protein